MDVYISQTPTPPRQTKFKALQEVSANSIAISFGPIGSPCPPISDAETDYDWEVGYSSESEDTGDEIDDGVLTYSQLEAILEECMECQDRDN